MLYIYLTMLNPRPPITLDKWQVEFLTTKGDKILCTGRQVGKSVVCSMDAAEYAINNPTSEPIVMIAPTERQAFGLFDKTLNYLLEKYPKAVVTRGKHRPTKTKITLKTGVKLYCLPVGSSGLGIRFLTIGRLYVDEASRLPEEVWEAITPALLMTGGDTIVLSTPFGPSNEFARIWTNKGGAYDSFTRFSTNSEEVVRTRVLCETWTEAIREKALTKLDQAKKRMSNRQYNQEYMGVIEEDLHRWFSDKLIADTCVLKRRDYIRPNAEHYMGVDIARMGEDEGTYEILDRMPDCIHQIESIITRKKLTTETEDKIRELITKYDLIKVYIDAGSGSLGVSIFDHLITDPTVRKRVVAINNAKRVVEYDPEGRARAVTLLKEDLYENLKALMEQGRIKLLDDDEIIMSLSSIQYEYVKKDGQPTKLRIHGDYSHVAEGLIRAAWCIKERHIKPFVSYI